MLRSEAFGPERMERVAIVAPRTALDRVLELVAETEAFEPDRRHAEIAAEAISAPRPAPDAAAAPSDARSMGDPPEARDELQQRAAAAIVHGRAAMYAGWTPQSQRSRLEEAAGRAGASVVALPRPRGIEPPTLVRPGGAGEPFRLLVRTFGIIPYGSLDPAFFAGATYAVMFGMMFGDVADGLLLALLGLYLRRRGGRGAAFSGLAIAGGLMGAVFGVLYGEVFGPTDLFPAVWLSPIDEPLELMVGALVLGTGLLGASYALGSVNRWREAGAAAAMYSASGVAGALTFFGGVTLAGGIALGLPWLTALGAVAVGLGAVLLFVGFLLAAGPGAGGAAQAAVELFDGVLRIGSNLVSFSRLAAFGLTHAAIGLVVWDATTALWEPGLWMVAAAVIFVIGHFTSFALEVLVVGVQALRLEYYELFSRVLTGEGREFAPWRLPEQAKEAGR